MTAACARTGLHLRLCMVSIQESGAAYPVWDGRHRYRGRWSRPIALEDSELAPPGALDDEVPDEDHFHEATGNEGGSFERTYRRAALVVWPPRNELRLLLQGGKEVAIAGLKRLSRSARTRADAEALATMIVDTWPRPRPNPYDPDRVDASDRVADRTALLGALAKLRDTGLLGRFLRELGWDWDEAPKERRTAAIVELVHAVAALQPSDLRGRRLVGELRQARDRWPLDDVVLPAALALTPRTKALRPMVEALRADVVDHLRARVALPLEPPQNAARSTDGLNCGCTDCHGLRAFLSDRRESTWTLRAAQDRRSHVQSAARGANADLTFRTVRTGSPHSLVCTKTQASYEARVRQRQADLAVLAKLGAAGRAKRRGKRA